VLSLGGGPGTCLFVMALIAAFTTCTKGGFIPHARHGASGVRAFAVAGSKFEGTGFENEQIGQTQVALWEGVGAGEDARERSGLPLSGVVESGLCAMPVGSGEPRGGCFTGLGNRVILGEDLRKPAYDFVRHCFSSTLTAYAPT
jgi:hypothetical protein